MKIVVVDIETSGFQRDGGKIVEIGAVGLNLETGNVKVIFDQVVREMGFDDRHTRHPYGWVFQNSDLNFEEVMAAPYLADTAKELQRILDLFPATAFNKKFDFSFLKSRGFRINELPCIMLSAAPVVNLPPNPGFSDPKWPKVEEAWKHFFPDIPYTEKHRAADDAMHEAMIAYKLYKTGTLTI